MPNRERFIGAVNCLFERLGIDADYLPLEGVDVPILVVPRREDKLFELGESQIHSDDPQFDFRVAQIGSPGRGDDIRIGDEIYRIEAEPRIDIHQLVWTVDTLRL